MAEATFWTGRRVFVTGVTGLLGSWLVDECLRLGASVVALVRDWVPDSLLVLSGNHLRITRVAGCLEDYDVVERSLNEYEIDTVFHLGAQPIVPVANRSPRATFEANIKGTWNVLEACRQIRCVSGVIVASSDKAYGSSPTLPYTEDTPLRGEHPYDVSKSCADLLTRSYSTTYHLPATVTRCGNIYGPGDLNFNRIVPGTIRSVLAGESPIIRSDGTYTRDYIYVRDAVSACLRVAENIERSDVRGQAFNFSNEKPVSVLDLVTVIIRMMGVLLEPTILNTSGGEIRNQYLSSAKARAVLGWQPTYTLDDGLRETIEWYRDLLEKRGRPALGGPP
jgi:CDP-glucose 4,6-dehydratase